MNDLISRQATIDAIREMSPELFSAYQHNTYVDKQAVMVRLMALPSVQPKIIRCKNCKHFTLNFIENVDGVPLIVAHEICSFWGDGCKTSQDGFCSFGERKDED